MQWCISFLVSLPHRELADWPDAKAAFGEVVVSVYLQVVHVRDSKHDKPLNVTSAAEAAPGRWHKRQGFYGNLVLDRFNLPVSDLERTIAFYEAVLRTLNMPLLMKDADAVGFGKSTWEFGIVKSTQGVAPVHVAFSAMSREAVRNFHEAALEAGGRDNGRPGIRTGYDPSYYAAYVLDPDAHNVEAVCRHEDCVG